MSEKHTPTPAPWEICGGYTPAYTCITAKGQYIVFGMADYMDHKEHEKPINAPDFETQRLNAAHIVRCVNHHSALVAALKNLIESVERYEPTCRKNLYYPEYMSRTANLARQALSALEEK